MRAACLSPVEHGAMPTRSDRAPLPTIPPPVKLRASSHQTTVPSASATPQRSESRSTSWSPKPPPACRSGRRRVKRRSWPASATSSRSTRSVSSAVTSTGAPAGASACRTLFVTSSLRTSSASLRTPAASSPLTQRPNRSRASAGARGCRGSRISRRQGEDASVARSSSSAAMAPPDGSSGRRCRDGGLPVGWRDRSRASQGLSKPPDHPRLRLLDTEPTTRVRAGRAPVCRVPDA